MSEAWVQLNWGACTDRSCVSHPTPASDLTTRGSTRLCYRWLDFFGGGDGVGGVGSQDLTACISLPGHLKGALRNHNQKRQKTTSSQLAGILCFLETLSATP